MDQLNRALLQAAGAKVSAVVSYDLEYAVFNGSPLNSFNPYDGQLQPVANTYQSGLYFKPDGTKFFTVNYRDDAIHQYSLSTAWDIGTASADNVTLSVYADERNPTGLFFKPDGTKLYIIGTYYKYVRQYSLSTAWDLSTASLEESYYVNITQIRCIQFNDDGTRFYVTAQSSDLIYQYDTSTAWNVSGATSAGSFSIATYEGAPTAFAFSSDGETVYLTGANGDGVDEFSLSTAWDITTASFTAFTSFSSLLSYEWGGIAINNNGDKIYLLGYQIIHQLDLTTAWDSTTASYSLPSTDYESISSKRLIALNDDGTKIYLLEIGTIDRLYEFPLSTAWDPTTIGSYNTRIGVYDTIPTGFAFSPDGTKLFTVGFTNDTVTRLDLSTAWDLTTASFHSNKLVISNPSGLAFKNDGTRMYLYKNGDLSEYSMTTAWAVSSATLLGSTSFLSTAGVNVSDIKLNATGTKLFLLNSVVSVVFQYELSTAWDASTASLEYKFPVPFQGMSGMTFADSGTRFYTVTNSSTSPGVFYFSITE